MKYRLFNSLTDSGSDAGGGAPPAAAPTDGGGAPPAAAAAPMVAEWMKSLPDDIRGEDSLKNIKDVENLARGYVHAQKLVGVDKIPVPNQYATEQDWRNVFLKLGLPEQVDKYELGIENNKDIDKPFFDGFKQAAHGANILPSQAKKIVEWFDKAALARGEEVAKQQTEMSAKEMTDLKNEFGQAYDSKISAARAAVRKFGDEKFTKFLDESGLAKNANMIRLFSKIGESFGEHEFKDGPLAEPAYMTPAKAIDEINKIKGDRTGAYYDARHPQHKKAVEDTKKLFELAYPPKKED